MPRISALPPLTGSLGSTDAFPFLKRTANLTERVDFNTLQSAVANAGVVQSLIGQNLQSALGGGNPAFPSITVSGPATFGSNISVAGNAAASVALLAPLLTSQGTLNIRFPGANQLGVVNWNGDIFIFRQGLGRLGLEMVPDGTNDSAIDVMPGIAAGQGSNRLRIWAYEPNVVADQSYFEITNSRDIGLEGMYIASRASGAGSFRPMFFQTGGVTQLAIDISGNINLTNKIYPGTPGVAAQSGAGIFAGNGLASNALGNVGDSYFRGDGGLGSNIYKKFAVSGLPAGSWTPII